VVKHEFLHIVDHAQFYLADETYTTDTSTLWSNQECDAMAVICEDILAIGTMRSFGETQIRIEVTDTKPNVDEVVWDHCVEGSITVTSGHLVLFSPESDYERMPRIGVPSGTYQVVVLYENVASVADELEYTGDDTYTILLWPGSRRQMSVRKRNTSM
jgi:hypothetical protein